MKQESKNKSKKTYECYPGNNQLKDLLFRWNYVTRKPIYDFVVDFASESAGKVVLDLGCGNMPYRNIFSDAQEYIGLDVDTAKKYGFRSDGVLYYDGRDIPLGDNTVDCVISIQVFECILDLDHTLDEVYRVMKKGAKFCITVPMVGQIHCMPYDYRRFTNFGLKDRLERHGFVNISITGSNRRIDTVRYLRISTIIKPFRKLYTTYQNLTFAYGRSRVKEKVNVLENAFRRLCGRGLKPVDNDLYPLDYLVYCEK